MIIKQGIIMRVKLIICLSFICLSLLFSTCATQNSNIEYFYVYTLSENEKLSTFIETQNKMNEYSKLENIPTVQSGKDIILSYSEIIKVLLDKENYSEEFFEEYIKLHFIYIIFYNQYDNVWHISLNGISTSLIIDYTSNNTYARKNDMNYSRNLIPNINRWMELNNIPSLDDSIRLCLTGDNNNPGSYVIEVFGKPLDILGNK
jgi:hypothetical protein